MTSAQTDSADYWTGLEITGQDLEYLHTFLFEREAPLTAQELAQAFVENRIQAERAAKQSEQQGGARPFLPKEKYQAGDELVFPALDWKHGRVTGVRAGANPSAGPFDVIAVTIEGDGEHLFAANLPSHRLNELPASSTSADGADVDSVLRSHGAAIVSALETAFRGDGGLVRIAGRWFPRSLLVDVNVGHLNLAEAVLDMAAGEPQPTANLLKDVELPEGADPKLAEFSLNLALQEDERFDEVGPAGEVLWCLRRLEPDSVRSVPVWLQYAAVPHDRGALSPEMLELESQLDDELSPAEGPEADERPSSLTISLIYPHLRSGTLPMSARARKLFPTAYESPRVRFTLVDGKTRQKIPGWVVREHGYVYGLRDWYKAHQLIPGSLVNVRRGERAGEVIVEARIQRSSKDWVRTLMVGADGGMVFAMLKQAITAEFNDRMAIHVPDFKLLDPLWEKKRPLEDLVISVMGQLTKLNPQGHTHAQELYAAVNLVRRVPPAPLFALLLGRPVFKHLGDLHFGLDQEAA